MEKNSVLRRIEPRFQKWVFSSFIAAAGVFVLDRGIAWVNNVGGAHGLNAVSLIALFGWSAVVLLMVSALVLLCRTVSDSMAHRLSKPALVPYLFGGFVALLSAVPFFFIGRDFASGDWISHQSFAWAVHAVPALLGPIGIGVLGWIFNRYNAGEDTHLLRRRAIHLLFAMISLACIGMIVFLSFGAYANFQLMLYVLSLTAALAAAYRCIPFLTKRLPTRALRILSAVALIVVLIPSGMAVGMSRNTRSELMVKSTTMAQLARTTGRLFSGSLLQNTLLNIQVASSNDAAPAALERGLIKAGPDWNVLLLVVDCLRADVLPPNRTKGLKHIKPGDTPFMDELVASSFRFRHAYAQGSRTLQSMPALFRSLEPYDHPRRVGQPLGTYARELGLTPIAVVNDVFMRPWRKQFQELLSGFEKVSIFEDTHMDTQMDRALSIIQNESSPFLAWIHIHSVHAPYFDGRKLKGKDGPVTTRYRRGVKWADGQIKKLFDGLDKMGRLDKTVVILAADHGENLGANNVKSHGFTVFEEAIRVPLAIRIPGRKGRLIEQTVGNIDILPTIADLFGAKKNPSHRGRSLVPLMVNPEMSWPFEYHTRNAGGEMYSVVRGRDKLVYDAEAETLYRFDLTVDPQEDHNLFSLKGELDQSLLRSILTFQPERFADELEKPSVQRLLEETILSLNPKSPGDAIGFLVKLAARNPTKAVEKHLMKVFKQAKDDPVRIAVQQGMYRSNKRLWKKALVSRLKQIAGTKQEVDYVSRLAAASQRPFDHRLVATRMKWWMEQGDDTSVEPWLRLIANWRKPTRFSPLLVTLLEKYASKTDAVGQARLALVLENMANTKWGGEALLEKARMSAHRLYEHEDILVQKAVFKALGTIGNDESVRRLTATLANRTLPLQVRQSAMNAVTALEHEKAIPLIVEYGSEPTLQSDAIVLLQRLDHLDGIPFLQRIEQTHSNGLFRSSARKAIDRIVNTHFQKRAKALAKESVDDLADRVENGEKDDRVAALLALRIKAPKQKSAIEIMVPMLADEDELVRGIAFQKLKDLKRRSVPFLIAALASDYPFREKRFVVKERKRSLKSVVNAVLIELQDVSIDSIIKAMDSSDDGVRLEASYLLGRMIKNTQKAVSAMVAAIDDPSWRVRRSLIHGMARLAPKNKSVRQAIKKCLDDENDRVKAKAKSILSRI